MEELRLGDQLVRYDRVATSKAYSSLPTGGAECCGCRDCQNFIAQRAAAYPDHFRGLLDQLGIDPDKEGEVFSHGPPNDSWIDYGGWFYLIGELAEAGERLTQLASGFDCFFSKVFPKAARSFEGSVISLEFHTRVHWGMKKDEQE